ncbi:MAG: hypothetical protein PUG16_08220 [Lachnospiraceae bacterium]|nr:hypothetical protein [Lachnospiraceae bacterium]
MIAHYHLPGLFEFYEFYKAFLPLYREHPEYFYDWCRIESIYGAPADCLWGGGRAGFGEDRAEDVISLMNEYGISPRLTFSNSLLTEKDLTDRNCQRLCSIFENSKVQSGIIIYSDLLMDFLQKNYPNFYFVSSTTKVLTRFDDFKREVDRPDFSYAVIDFRLNHALSKLEHLTQKEKDKVEFLCNECCSIGCKDRKQCYENVSRKNLGLAAEDFRCASPTGKYGYRFSLAMESPAFIGIDQIQKTYLPLGFSNFKIEGRSLGSAILLEFILYYMTKPEYQLKVREEIYLDSMLDLF